RARRPAAAGPPGRAAVDAARHMLSRCRRSPARSSPSSAPPRPARAPWRSPWPSGWAGRSSAPARSRPAAGSTSGRPSRAPRGGGGGSRRSAYAPAMPPIPRPVLAAVGATATGKSALALALAERLGGEIVSADALQAYRGFDIGTAKPTAEERARVPHHLLDI